MGTRVVKVAMFLSVHERESAITRDKRKRKGIANSCKRVSPILALIPFSDLSRISTCADRFAATIAKQYSAPCGEGDMIPELSTT